MAYDPIKALIERNRSTEEARAKNTLEIGIFGFMDGKLVPFTIPYTEVNAVAGFRDGPNEHVHFFRTFQRMMPGLEHAEYTDHPRGRVLYHEERGRFLCYGFRQFVASARERQCVLDASRLPLRRPNSSPTTNTKTLHQSSSERS